MDQLHTPFLMGNEQKLYMLNRLRPLIQPALVSASPDSKVVECWSPSSIEHEIMDAEESPTKTRYPSRERRPPDWFRP